MHRAIQHWSMMTSSLKLKKTHYDRAPADSKIYAMGMNLAEIRELYAMQRQFQQQSPIHDPAMKFLAESITQLRSTSLALIDPLKDGWVATVRAWKLDKAREVCEAYGVPFIMTPYCYDGQKELHLDLRQFLRPDGNHDTAGYDELFEQFREYGLSRDIDFAYSAHAVSDFVL